MACLFQRDVSEERNDILILYFIRQFVFSWKFGRAFSIIPLSGFSSFTSWFALFENEVSWERQPSYFVSVDIWRHLKADHNAYFLHLFGRGISQAHVTKHVFNVAFVRKCWVVYGAVNLPAVLNAASLANAFNWAWSGISYKMYTSFHAIVTLIHQ